MEPVAASTVCGAAADTEHEGAKRVCTKESRALSSVSPHVTMSAVDYACERQKVVVTLLRGNMLEDQRAVCRMQARLDMATRMYDDANRQLQMFNAVREKVPFVVAGDMVIGACATICNGLGIPFKQELFSVRTVELHVHKSALQDMYGHIENFCSGAVTVFDEQVILEGQDEGTIVFSVISML